MTHPTQDQYSDAQRMELRTLVELAGEVIAQYWPMRTFIHHNPLHGLEQLPFEEAVRRGSQLFGGRGYLPNEQYRRHLNNGRIREEDLRAALEPLAAHGTSLTFAGRRLTQLDVLTASMAHGIMESIGSIDTVHAEESPLVESLSALIRAHLPEQATPPDVLSAPSHDSALPADETLGGWCDHTFGTAIVDTINREIVKWCSAFLDEGEASWTMPEREQNFYRVWKFLAQHDFTCRLIGIKDGENHIRSLPDRPEDAVIEHLLDMKIPKAAWEQYLSLHLASLPGWTGYIKWRAYEGGHPWQHAFPIDLVKYLAVRLFYERELVKVACSNHVGMGGQVDAIGQYMDRHPYAYQLRRAWIAGLVPLPIAKEVRPLARSKKQNHQAWEELGRQYDQRRREQQAQQYLYAAVHRLLRLARGLSIDPTTIESTDPSNIRMLLAWLEGFPAAHQGPVWLKAFEASHRRETLMKLTSDIVIPEANTTDGQSAPRPLAQMVFCIDVRSEVFRRHLEHLGGYETLGLAGFFGVPLDYQPLGAHQAVAHCPVLLKPKNQVREVPRSYHGALADRHKTAAQINEAAHELLHDLKENVVTPYVMVEALGWFFSLPLFGRTFFPVLYEKARQWFQRVFVPPPATTLTVEKLARAEAEEMVATEQLTIIREVVRKRFNLSAAALSPTLLDKIRKNTIGNSESLNGEVAKVLGLTTEAEAAFYQELRDRYLISPRGISARLNRLTHTGFSVSEQAYFVEAALRLMGTTTTFARVVLFCAHGSTSQNNPYESALDCGACGGNHGLPNARAVAAMGNKSAVRELLQVRGIKIPTDTHFFAAEHDTTTDEVRVVDLEDVPATHRKDLQRLISDVDEAGRQAALERAGALQQPAPLESRVARQGARRRSRHWAEVRPEWGLSKNSLIIIGRRVLTQRVNLQGRSFLHSYDYQQDGSGKLLETIMTAPLVVAQWINMEHYFSTVDNQIYGSGSKIYHNVVARIGVMTGVWSDLRLGLPAQTVWNGSVPYHEPMRLLAVIEAPRERIQGIIDRQPLLDQLFTLGWVGLVALDPKDKQFYGYHGRDGWKHEAQDKGGIGHGRVNTASDEGNQNRRAGRSLEVHH